MPYENEIKASKELLDSIEVELMANELKGTMDGMSMNHYPAKESMDISVQHGPSKEERDKAVKRAHALAKDYGFKPTDASVSTGGYGDSHSTRVSYNRQNAATF
jgi:hypothetical protein